MNDLSVRLRKINKRVRFAELPPSWQNSSSRRRRKRLEREAREKEVRSIMQASCEDHYRWSMRDAFEMMCHPGNKARVSALLLNAARVCDCLDLSLSHAFRTRLEMHVLDMCVQDLVCASEDGMDDDEDNKGLFDLGTTLCDRALDALNVTSAVADLGRSDYLHIRRRLCFNIGRLMQYARRYEEAATWHCLALRAAECGGGNVRECALRSAAALCTYAEIAAEQNRPDDAREAAFSCLDIVQDKEYDARLVVSAYLVLTDQYEKSARRTENVGDLWNALRTLLLCLSQFRAGVVPAGVSTGTLRHALSRVKNILQIIENEMGDVFEVTGLYPSLLLEAHGAMSRFA